MKTLYTFYNENIFEDDGISRVKEAIGAIFFSGDSFVFIGMGQPNPDETHVDFHKLKTLLHELKAEFLIPWNSDESAVALLRYDEYKIHDLMHLLSSFANCALFVVEDINSLVGIYNSFGFTSKYTLTRYLDIIFKSISINNVQHHFSVCLKNDYTQQIRYFDNFLDKSKYYNLGLEGIKEQVT